LSRDFFVPAAVNRLTGVSGSATATFVYDGDGQRVKGTVAGVTTAYIGNYYEWTGSATTAKKYYYAGSQRIAMRTGSSTLNYLLGDHLGSTSITADSAGARVAELMYKAWGENRYTYLTTPTTLRFTGQRQESGLGGADGLYYYGARWYDPALGRFAQADSIVPEPDNPQSLNRFSYTLNNPLKYTDPSGHSSVCGSANSDPECDTLPVQIWSEAEVAQTRAEFTQAFELIAGVLWEPADWAITARDCAAGICSPLAILGLLPLIPSSLTKYVDNIIDAIPRGFGSADEFKAFGDMLSSGLRQAGYDDVVPAFRGSSVTGVSHTTGEAFDVGRVSDYDISLASPTLMKKADEAGIPLRSSGTRTGPLRSASLDQLGLTALATQLTETAGRPVSFMIYDSTL
jgi:RHS repeat-associated protein